MNKVIEELGALLPAYHWYTVLPQLVSRVHDRKEAASEDKDALEKLANAVITLGRLSSQAEDIAGARAAERAEEACWELMKENHRRKGALTDASRTHRPP